MTFIIRSQEYRVAEHIWRDHLDRVGLVTMEQIQETISSPERTELVRGARVLYLRWFAEIGSRGNYLAVIVDQNQNPHVVVTAMPNRNERRRRRRQQ
jgi:hypothetical protein